MSSNDGAAPSPHFIIIGAMKAGTTSLYQWLAVQPETWLTDLKEPHFYSRHWDRGIGWYRGLFAQAPPGMITGEASASYSLEAFADQAADRIARTVPEVKIIYLIRHPVERIRSHYRHEVQRGREKRSFAEAVQDPAAPYVGASLYGARLAPYLDRFARKQVLMVRSEDLRPEGGAWAEVLSFLGLEHRPQPAEVYNVSVGKRRYTALLRWLWASGHAPDKLLRLPRPVRRVGRALLLRDGSRYQELIASAKDSLRPSICERLQDDLDALSRSLELSVSYNLHSSVRS